MLYKKNIELNRSPSCEIVIYNGKKSALNETRQNGFVDLKKLPNELKCRKKVKFKYTEP